MNKVWGIGDMPIKTSVIDPELALRIVRESRFMCYDVETSGLVAGKDFICGHVITDWTVSTYTPVRHQAGGNIPDADEFRLELGRAFADRHRLGYRTVGHFLGFDLRMALWDGITILGPLEDTAINESLIDDRTRGYGLDDCAVRHQVTAKRGDELYRHLASIFGGIPDRKQMQHFFKLAGDDPIAVDYATGDGVSTLELWESQQRILDEEGLRVPHQLECDLLPYVARIHRRGIRIDSEYGEKVNGLLQADVDKRKEAFPAGFNPRSPTDVEKLYLANGFQTTDFDRTATGKPSFTESWLDTNDIGESILGIRRLEKARDSFVAPLVGPISTGGHNVNGRVHPILHQSKSDDYGVAGARFSCSDPNLQAFPKRRKEVGKIVRALVIPDDGMVLEEGDAMQQEPRLFTHYSGDSALIEGYTNDPLFSIHKRADDMMFNGQDYDKAKRMAMGILSMMGVRALAGHLRISQSESSALRKKFLYNAFPDIGKFQDMVVSVYEKRGYVKSILGRKARLESPKYAYQGVSRVIQNSAGDHLKTVMLLACQFEDAYPDVIQILLTIHDSLIWQRDPSKIELLKEFVALLESVPHRPEFNLRVPIPFEVGSGGNWSIASYGEKIKEKTGWVI